MERNPNPIRPILSVFSSAHTAPACAAAVFFSDDELMQKKPVWPWVGAVALLWAVGLYWFAQAPAFSHPGNAALPIAPPVPSAAVPVAAASVPPQPLLQPVQDVSAPTPEPMMQQPTSATPAPAVVAFYTAMGEVSQQLAHGQALPPAQLEQMLQEQQQLVQQGLLSVPQAQADLQFLQKVLPAQQARLEQQQQILTRLQTVAGP